MPKAGSSPAGAWHLMEKATLACFVTRNGSHIAPGDWSRVRGALDEAPLGRITKVALEKALDFLKRVKGWSNSDIEQFRKMLPEPEDGDELLDDLDELNRGREYDRRHEVSRRERGDPVGDAVMARARALADHGDFGRAPPSPPRSEFADRGMALDEKNRERLYEIAPGLRRILEAG